MLGGEVEGDPDLPRMQAGLVGDGRDPLFLITVQVVEAGDDLPDIRAGSQRCAAIMWWSAEDHTRVVERVHAFDDEPLEQRGRAPRARQH